MVMLLVLALELALGLALGRALGLALVLLLVLEMGPVRGQPKVKEEEQRMHNCQVKFALPEWLMQSGHSRAEMTYYPAEA